MKVKNLKISKKLMSLILAGTLSLTLGGCSNNDNDNDSVLEGTVLENTCVVTFENGDKDIAVVFDACDDSEHYHSVISDICYANKDCKDFYARYGYDHLFHHYDIINEESINKYLTKEEFEKAYKKELTDDDILNIMTRVLGENNEEININTNKDKETKTM